MNKFIPGLLLAATLGMSLSAAAYADNKADQKEEAEVEEEADAASPSS